MEQPSKEIIVFDKDETLLDQRVGVYSNIEAFLQGQIQRNRKLVMATTSGGDLQGPKHVYETLPPALQRFFPEGLGRTPRLNT